jgi:hypothetical protein
MLVVRMTVDSESSCYPRSERFRISDCRVEQKDASPSSTAICTRHTSYSLDSIIRVPKLGIRNIHHTSGTQTLGKGLGNLLAREL